uniref:Rad21_Rec8 domain-containing protein n=1 Tax=Macrostomum lignano TaxID=282301 RepID=A0A1I8F3F5_9PLAT
PPQPQPQQISQKPPLPRDAKQSRVKASTNLPTDEHPTQPQQHRSSHRSSRRSRLLQPISTNLMSRSQDKTLCVKYSMVYKFRIRVLQEGYQIWNEHNSTREFGFASSANGAQVREPGGVHCAPSQESYPRQQRRRRHHPEMPFQLVPRCQQELDFQQISLDAAIFTTGSVAAVSNKVARMRSGNFLVLRRSQQPLLQQPGESESTDSSAAAGAGVLSTAWLFGTTTAAKTFTLAGAAQELVTDRIEKMVHFLCHCQQVSVSDITLLVKP